MTNPKIIPSENPWDGGQPYAGLVSLWRYGVCFDNWEAVVNWLFGAAMVVESGSDLEGELWLLVDVARIHRDREERLS